VRVLVTGASGFVGGYLVAHLRERGHEVVAAGGPHDADFLPVDLLDRSSLVGAIEIARPDAIVHLAASTFVPDSLADPLGVYETHALGTARLLSAVRSWRESGGGNPRILFTSSAEVYGSQPPDAFPLHESLALHPANPYDASKAAAEALIAGESAAYGLDVIVARAFNHIGPGQRERFVVAGFAAQLAKIAAEGSGTLWVGNLKAKRDFLDVRDVVAAYAMLLERCKTGETYNVCSGTAVGIDEVLRELINVARVPVEVREDPERMRPSDVPVFYGSSERLQRQTGWKPSISLRASLRAIYEAAAQKQANEQPAQ